MTPDTYEPVPVKVDVPCHNAKGGCPNTVQTLVAPGAKPPRLICQTCKEIGAPSERSFGFKCKAPPRFDGTFSYSDGPAILVTMNARTMFGGRAGPRRAGV